MSSRHKGEDGDWICSDSKCENLNFARRSSCNRCGKGKPYKESSSKRNQGMEIGKSAAEKSHGLFSAEDWQCAKCGNVNWARRNTCNVCNAPRVSEEETRTGYGGGFNEREGVEYIRREDSDDEYDEFGRKKKKFRKKNVESGDSASTEKILSDQKLNESRNDEDDDDDDGDLSKYDIWGDDDDEVNDDSDAAKDKSDDVNKNDDNIKSNKRSRSRSSTSRSSYDSNSREEYGSKDRSSPHHASFSSNAGSYHSRSRSPPKRSRSRDRDGSSNYGGRVAHRGSSSYSKSSHGSKSRSPSESIYDPFLYQKRI